MKIGGKQASPHGNNMTKAQAQKKANALRKKGYRARVLPRDGRYSVVTLGFKKR